MEKTEWDKLSPAEKARKIAVVKLLRHFRGLERTGILPKEEARKQIGAVLVLEAIAKGEFKPKEDSKKNEKSV